MNGKGSKIKGSNFEREVCKILSKMWKLFKKSTCECTKACTCLVVGVVAGVLLQHHFCLTDIAHTWLSFLLM